MMKCSLKLALYRSYVSDVTIENDSNQLTLRQIPAALFFLNILEECLLSPLAGAKKVRWPIPETDAFVILEVTSDSITIRVPFSGSGHVGANVLRFQIDVATRMFYDSLRDLVLPDTDHFSLIGPLVADNVLLREVFRIPY
jgi:hypothetical protein